MSRIPKELAVAAFLQGRIGFDQLIDWKPEAPTPIPTKLSKAPPVQHAQHAHVDPWESGGDTKTAEEVAVHIKRKVTAVKRMTRADAQRRARPGHAIPSFLTNAKGRMFSRVQIDEWLKIVSTAEPIRRPVKGKVKRKR